MSELLQRSMEALEQTAELVGVVDAMSKRLADLEKTVHVLIRQNIALEAVLHGHQKAWEALIANEDKQKPKRVVN